MSCTGPRLLCGGKEELGGRCDDYMVCVISQRPPTVRRVCLQDDSLKHTELSSTTSLSIAPTLVSALLFRPSHALFKTRRCTGPDSARAPTASPSRFSCSACSSSVSSVAHHTIVCAQAESVPHVTYPTGTAQQSVYVPGQIDDTPGASLQPLGVGPDGLTSYLIEGGKVIRTQSATLSPSYGHA